MNETMLEFAAILVNKGSVHLYRAPRIMHPIMPKQVCAYCIQESLDIGNMQYSAVSLLLVGSLRFSVGISTYVLNSEFYCSTLSYI